MLSKILPLAIGPHDLTQAEEEKLFSQAEQIHKMILCQKSCHFE